MKCWAKSFKRCPEKGEFLEIYGSENALVEEGGQNLSDLLDLLNQKREKFLLQVLNENPTTSTLINENSVKVG